jgi:hypothetical protein
MKTLVISAVVFIFSISVFAGGQMGIEDKDYNRVELNLLIGLSSDNLGLRTSSAQMLGDILSQKAVFPLMSMLKDDKHEEARIVAALALSKIGSPVGMFAVKQATRFDESERVRKMCSNFYNAIVSVSYADLLIIATN